MTISRRLAEDQQKVKVPSPNYVSKASVVRTYERFAPTYDATFGAIVGRYHRHIGQLTGSIGAHRILEIGVGTGLSLRHYAAGTSMIGVDICPRMLEKAQ